MKSILISKIRPKHHNHTQSPRSSKLAAIGLLAATLLPTPSYADVPQRLIDNHRANMGCWLADIDNDELVEQAVIIRFDVQILYGLTCTSGLSGNSYRFYQVEDGRDEWAKLLSFPQLDTKLGWFATTQLEKPTFDTKKKLLRAEVRKQGQTSSCRQFSIYSWQKGHFHIAQIGLSGECEEKEGDKDMIIYPFVEEVEKGEASGQGEADKKADKPKKKKKK